MPVTSSVLLGLLLLVAIRRRGLPTRNLANVSQDLIYGAKSLGSSLRSCVACGVPNWGMSRGLGASTFGSWNRATVVGQVPLESAARAVTTVIFPKFRWDGTGGENVRRRWSSLLASTALVVLPLVALVIPAVPTLTRILLGSRWTEAGVMAQFIVAATAVNVLNSLLGMALQASNNFRAVWLSQVAMILILTIAAIALLAWSTWVAIAIGFVIASIASHTIQLLWASGAGLVASGTVVKWYATTAAACAVMWGLGSVAVASTTSAWGALALIVLASSITLAALYIMRRRIEPLASIAGERDA